MGFVCLASVLGLYSRKVAGSSMADHIQTELVLVALNMPFGQRRTEEVVHHSD